jgi:hypothetical protein
MNKKEIPVNVKWSYPRDFENAKETIMSYEGFGLYCISRIFGENETIIYIGKTKSRFRDRLKEHQKKWILNYRGKIIVRFGTITIPETVTEDLLIDVESAIIYEIQPIQNTDKKNQYHFNKIYKIINEGYLGKLPKQICIKDHL